MDAVGSNIRVDSYGWEVKRILPRINENINEEWISDKTRYACDGILNQRLDTPYLKSDNEFKKISWDLAYKKVVEKIKETSAEKIAGLTGDLTNMETMFIVKEFFQKTIKSQNLDSRSDNYYVNNNDRRNYIFNSSLNGIEESDLIILVGANPRYEATILNARIRKSFLNNKTDIYSFGDIGDLTYPYKILDNKTDTIKDVFENKNELSEKIKNSKKPIIILGQSALRLKSGKFIFEEFKRFLISVNKINKDWNSLNILSNHASTIGSYDLNILSSKDGKNITLNQIKNNNFDILFLFGQDSLSLKKKNEFIIYIGSHGDKGAEMADVILPGTTYTEQDGYYINLEGKIQKAYKASYPPGDAKEDWEIINELSELLKRKKIYKNKEELIDRMMNYLKLDQKFINKDKIITEFSSEKIVIDSFDYYYSNVIARASKTMSECRNEKLKVKSTGTDG